MATARTHRVDDRVVVPLAMLAGVVAALGPAEPTGGRVQDVALVVMPVALVTWAGATARWWALVVLAVSATAIASSLVLVVVGAVSVAVAVWIGTQLRDLPTARAVVVAVSLNVAIRSDIGGFLGLSAIITIGASVVVVVSGVRRRRGGVRRGAAVGLSAVAALAVLAVVGSAIAAAGASNDLRDGSRLARDGISMLGNGDYAAAADRFDQAAGAFASSNEQLESVWSKPSAWLPVIAQQRSATATVSATAAGASNDLAVALRVVDPEQLRLVGGRFDLDAIRLIEQPFVAVRESIADLRGAIDRADSPWLIAPIAERLTDLDAELIDNGHRPTNAVDAIQLAPGMLGADGPRRYFMAFTTPAEARGIGGFMGNWAVLTADNGRSAARPSSARDARPATSAAKRRGLRHGPRRLARQWGRYGFTNGPGGSTEPDPWSNVTISPVFPSTAQVIDEMLPQSGGGDLSTGRSPWTQTCWRRCWVDRADLGGRRPTSGSPRANMLQFLLVDQYEIDDTPTRVDLLEDVSRAIVERVLGGRLPNPTVVARELAPLAAQGRLVGWSADPASRPVRVGRTSRALPALDGGDGMRRCSTTLEPNKIDVYLERDVTYARWSTSALARVGRRWSSTLAQHRRPRWAAGFGRPATTPVTHVGTNRTLLSLYAALTLVEATHRRRPSRLVHVRTRSRGRLERQLGIRRHPPGGLDHRVTEYVRRTLELDEPATRWRCAHSRSSFPSARSSTSRRTDGSTLIRESRGGRSAHSAVCRLGPTSTASSWKSSATTADPQPTQRSKLTQTARGVCRWCTSSSTARCGRSPIPVGVLLRYDFDVARVWRARGCPRGRWLRSCCRGLRAALRAVSPPLAIRELRRGAHRGAHGAVGRARA